MPLTAKGAIQPKISGCTRKGSTIQKSAAPKNPTPAAHPTAKLPRAPRVASSSQTSGGSARNSTHQAETGGWLSASAAPPTRASPSRAAPESPATRRSTPITGNAGLFRRGRSHVRSGIEPHPQPLDPAGVGVDDLELVPVGMRDHLAARRQPPGEPDHEAAQRVDLLGHLGIDQPHARGGLEVVEVHPR